jgi:23S rRNA (pseudouridine1915-N3)-methyltransferase
MQSYIQRICPFQVIFSLLNLEKLFVFWYFSSMKIKIIALGKIKEKFLKSGIEEFLKRLTPYSSLEIVELSPIEIKDENLTEKVLELEGEKILAHIKPNSYVITLEIQGKQLSSEEFANKINEIMILGISELVFVIGSSCGLAPIVSKRADFKLSFSKMTFLHQFARLILIEQIYRAFKILKSETYHK